MKMHIEGLIELIKEMQELLDRVDREIEKTNELLRNEHRTDIKSDNGEVGSPVSSMRGDEAVTDQTKSN